MTDNAFITVDGATHAVKPMTPPVLRVLHGAGDNIEKLLRVVSNRVPSLTPKQLGELSLHQLSEILNVSIGGRSIPERFASAPLTAPDTPLTEEELASLERIRAHDPRAGRWLDEFLSGRRYYVTWSRNSPFMHFRMKTAKGLQNWRARRWSGGVHPDGIFEVTSRALRLVERILTLPAELRESGPLGPKFWVEVGIKRKSLAGLPEVIDFTPREFPRSPRTYLLAVRFENELPLFLKLEGDRFVARNLDDEWISGTGGPTPCD